MIAIASNPNRPQLEDIRAGLPNICGFERAIAATTNHNNSVFLPRTNLSVDKLTSTFACALHMHQPTIPAGANGEPISHLQYMFEHSGEGDNHNADAFAWCYRRMGEWIPQLVEQGDNPRIMLDYSGNLFWAFRQMNRTDIIDNLKRLCEPAYQPYVEWMGTMWSHAVIPSTPIPDIKLHIQAWQHHFAAMFGYDALARVKGFSPPEMHLPNHPDTLYEYVKALKECGYRWLLVQEHSVERPNGEGLHHDDKYIPNRLVARNSRGEETSITALIKTQGSDTKLVAQMQPYHEAKGRGRAQIGEVSVPCCVSQIADGENGGVMMNEYGRDFMPFWSQIRENGRSIEGTAGVNGTEYIELIEAAGVSSDDYPICQAVGQHKIWEKVNEVTPNSVASAIEELQQNDHSFHMDGASWTNDLSWVKGYENVLEPMNQLSAKFHQKYDRSVQEDPSVTQQQDYQEALLYLLLVETSCFRYWGQGRWTDYASALYRRGEAALQ